MSGVPVIDDAAIVRRVLDGDRDRFRILIERYQDRVFNLLVRVLQDRDTAQDIGQEAFLRAYLKLDQYKPDLSFGNWMLKIAQNLAFSHLKRGGVDRERLVLDGPEDRGAGNLPDPSPFADPQVRVEREAVAGLARDVMGRLSEKYRLVLTLRYTEELSYQEIAQILDIPLGTVKFRLHQAHRHLEDALVRYGVIAP